jgi:RNA polymerase sigma factor (sigma-70 family)
MLQEKGLLHRSGHGARPDRRGRRVPGGIPQSVSFFCHVQKGRQTGFVALSGHLQRLHRSPEEEEETLASGARDPSAVLFSSPSPDPDLSVESEMLQRKITRALEKVSPQEKAVFLLRHYDDLMLKEIAGVLDISLGSVKSYLFRAVRKLQKELGRGGAASGLEANHD